MNSIRLWVLLLAATSFLGGLAAGTLLMQLSDRKHVSMLLCRLPQIAVVGGQSSGKSSVLEKTSCLHFSPNKF